MAGLNAAAFEHGGPDALGAAEHDFSTNANACGPCPQAQAAVLRADASRYPDPGYGDYARAAVAHGMSLVPASEAQLAWHGDPASPTGQTTAPPGLAPGAVGVVDMAYAPLRLEGVASGAQGYWQLWTPNKALGLTGVRAAYAVAPPSADEALVQTLDALMPSWPIGRQSCSHCL